MNKETDNMIPQLINAQAECWSVIQSVPFDVPYRDHIVRQLMAAYIGILEARMNSVLASCSESDQKYALQSLETTKIRLEDLLKELVHEQV
jgi:hypothetical protein